MRPEPQSPPVGSGWPVSLVQAVLQGKSYLGMLQAHHRAKGPLQGPGYPLYFALDKLGDPAGEFLTSFLTSAELPFHEDCGQPFYLFCFGFPFLADLLQRLLVMLEF